MSRFARVLAGAILIAGILTVTASIVAPIPHSPRLSVTVPGAVRAAPSRPDVSDRVAMARARHAHELAARWWAGVHAAELARAAQVARAQPKRTVPDTSRATSLSSVNWDGIARCETGSNWSHLGNAGSGHTYQGGLGIYDQTWAGFGGHDFAPSGNLATREQQITVAERIYARHGLTGWGCRRYG